MSNSNTSTEPVIHAEIENEEFDKVEEKIEEELEQEHEKIEEEKIKPEKEKIIEYDNKIDPIVDNYINSLVNTKAMIRSDIETRMLAIIMSCKACNSEEKAKQIIEQKLEERPMEYDIVSNVKRLKKAYNVEKIDNKLYGGSLFKKTLVQDSALEQSDAKMEKKKKKREEMEEKKRKQLYENAGLVSAPTISVNKAKVDSNCKDVKQDNISIAYGKHLILEDADLTLAHGRRYGLIGRNGCGKSTLMRVIATRNVAIPDNMTMQFIEQEVDGDDRSVYQTVYEANVELVQLYADLAELEKEPLVNAEKITMAYSRLAELDADTAESRIKSILTGLQFTQKDFERPTKEFSGGWRMRISIAKAIYMHPDLLLLDEPSNHLDFHALIWLEEVLKNWDGTLLIVSHQRQFLNAIVTDIIHFKDFKLTYYPGDYDTFEATMQKRLLQQQRAYDAQQIQRKHIQQFIDRFKCSAVRGPQVQSRIKMMEKMKEVSTVVDDAEVTLTFPDVEPLDSNIVSFHDITFGYEPDKILFKNLNFALNMESRIALVGRNGCGKTTFLKLLIDALTPVGGTVQRNRKARIGVFAQHFVDQLNFKVNAIQFFQNKYPEKTVQEIRSHLGRFGITGDSSLQRLDTLSGGQKSRVVFADLAYKQPHLLLLDEPSNHLDIETVEALARALAVYQGGVLIITHDERLISQVCDEIWHLHDQTITKFPGDIVEYKRHVRAEIFK
ncbi:hypothetical protein ENUP19_0118G0036 [Entamoeba nuttalli]|uniref:ABC transporter domain-containing protein n=1 Tax=Entamoeba nuttalli TaxID=412467 RepID=A0ABQ0D9P5_9EUKA